MSQNIKIYDIIAINVTANYDKIHPLSISMDLLVTYEWAELDPTCFAETPKHHNKGLRWDD